MNYETSFEEFKGNLNLPNGGSPPESLLFPSVYIKISVRSFRVVETFVFVSQKYH